MKNLNKMSIVFFSFICLLVIGCANATKGPYIVPVNTDEGFKNAIQGFDKTDCFFATLNNSTKQTSMKPIGTSKITNASFSLLDNSGKMTDGATYEIVQVEPEQKTMVVPDEQGNPIEVTVTVGIANVQNTYGNKIKSGVYAVIYGNGSGMEILEIVHSDELAQNKIEQNFIAMLKM